MQHFHLLNGCFAPEKHLGSLTKAGMLDLWLCKPRLEENASLLSGVCTSVGGTHQRWMVKPHLASMRCNEGVYNLGEGRSRS